ncbi:MAG TPA: exodeoxyribonuclease VII large subunit [Thermoanaerobaculia bacterium]|jgi:exodeoxyribonuclease VII large subunit|nr:exodeoxyribonuclease VII large subunit [Thermoanaerobaculia bacterium]
MLPRPVPAAAPPRPYTVSELLSEVSSVLKTTWRDVSVVGEIGRFDERGGHGYFVLKDRTSTLQAIIFASDLKRVPFRMEPGLEVVVRGSLDLYAPAGKFQIKAFAIEPVGRGALQLAFEQLKARLEAEGLFEPARKRAIPKLPRRIAIVTSPAGAVIRDILHVLSRRFEGLAITVYPVRVQGELAAVEIAGAIAQLNRRAAFDVLILARGGGSPEDLAPFNDERVARALAASAIPTISGVGHEADVTIADLVADLRAPTPSAAAELVVERKDEIVRRLSSGRLQLLRAMRGRLALERSHLVACGRSDGLVGFPRRVAQWREAVSQGRDALVLELERRPAEYAARVAAARRLLEDFARVAQLPRRRDRVGNLRSLLVERAGRRLERRRGRLGESARKLEILSPLAVLARGYAVAYRSGATAPITASSQVEIGERIRVRLHEGELGAVVREGGRLPGAGPLFADREEES